MVGDRRKRVGGCSKGSAVVAAPLAGRGWTASGLVIGGGVHDKCSS
jgi:hypothetical protein